MSQSRREFLNLAWMGAAAVAAGGCVSKPGCCAQGGKMAVYADKPFANLRVGVIGLGRGMAGVTGFTLVPGSSVSVKYRSHHTTQKNIIRNWNS